MEHLVYLHKKSTVLTPSVIFDLMTGISTIGTLPAMIFKVPATKTQVGHMPLLKIIHCIYVEKIASVVSIPMQ